MRIRSYSKINLSLRVLKKLKSGIHDIETSAVLLRLFDELIIEKSKKDLTIFKGKFKKKINSKNNTILESLSLLRNLKIIKCFYKVVIKKNIPVFAGLGGGTGNAVSLIKYFVKKKLSEKLIVKFEKKIGSDFRLFLYNHTKQKKFKKVNKSKIDLKFHCIVVFPNIHCKTKNIYNLVKNFSSSSRNKNFKNIKAFSKERNDLQSIVIKKYPKIKQLIESIKKQYGCIFSRMTGSGSACYGVFKSQRTARIAFYDLKKKYPKYWCVITKTI